MAKKKTGNIPWDRIAWKRVIPLGILCILILYLILSLIFSLFKPKEKPDESIYTLCNLNSRQTLQLVEKEDRTNKVVVTDYNFYGESLNLYYNTYDRNMASSGTMDGEKVVLKDMCSDKTYEFDISRKVDSQILLGQLTPGFYSVYTVNGETYTRVYMGRTLNSNNTITTVTRNNERMTVELIANKKLFDSENATESVLDEAYLYLKVTKVDTSAEAVPNNDYDIVVFSAPARTLDIEARVGEQNNGIVEADELFEVAQQIVQGLTDKGLRVKLMKDTADADVKYYGPGGIANLVYNSKAKYMIYLDMTRLDYEIRTLHSYYSSNLFATPVFEQLRSVGFFTEDYQNDYATTETGDNEALGEFDTEYEIRELGGLVLGAGTYSEASSVNASFAARNIYGVNVLKICTTNIDVASSVSRWNEKKGQIADAVVNGVMEYLSKN